jgi:hypothetical protein
MCPVPRTCTSQILYFTAQWTILLTLRALASREVSVMPTTGFFFQLHGSGLTDWCCNWQITFSIITLKPTLSVYWTLVKWTSQQL